LVSAAIGRLGCWYSHGKANHTVFRLACETAEIGWRVAAFTTKPLIHRLEQPISRLNHLACSRLDQLETNFPIINTPTEEVVSRVKQAFTGMLAILNFENNDDDDQICADDSESEGLSDGAILSGHHTGKLFSHIQSASCIIVNPSVLFTYSDHLFCAIEKCFRQQYEYFLAKYGAVCLFVTDFSLSEFGCSLIGRASKHLDSYVSLVGGSVLQQSQIMDVETACAGGNGIETMAKWSAGQEYVMQLVDTILDFIIYYSPLVFLAPDFNNGELVPNIDDDFVDADGNVLQGIVGYVPLNPADLAALPPPRLRRNCWRRRP